MSRFFPISSSDAYNNFHPELSFKKTDLRRLIKETLKAKHFIYENKPLLLIYNNGCIRSNRDDIDNSPDTFEDNSGDYEISFLDGNPKNLNAFNVISKKVASKNSVFAKGLNHNTEISILGHRDAHVVITIEMMEQFINDASGDYVSIFFIRTSGKGISQKWIFDVDNLKKNPRPQPKYKENQ